jgi:uncharacterized protein
VTQEDIVQEAPISQKWVTCDGHQLCKLAQAGLYWLEHNCQHVNALNVFPVPDGDTGTNMLLTMRSAYNRIQNGDEGHVGKVAQELSQGALMGARGNSGVILSQIWRGLAKSLKNKAAFTTVDLAEALQEAADTAYKGVMRPVEGTILTVIREGAEEAQDAAEKSQDLRFMTERVLERCQQSLARTPDLLPILKQAGVVDSGGQGLVYLFEGMLRYVHGQLDEMENGAAAGVTAVPAQALAVPEQGNLEFPYDVQFILMGENLDVLKVRADIDAMGDSTVVVGDEKVIKVHIHVKDPGEPISYGIRHGLISDVVVENMQMQMEEIIQAAPAEAGQRGSLTRSPLVNEGPIIEPGQIGVIAVTAGAGLGRVFRSLGAAAVVNGGQTNNPSTEEIFQAIQDVPTNKIIILPNNKNIILTAEAARDLSPKDVVVVATRTAPQGISAMLSLELNGDLEAVAEAMQEMSTQVVSGEITRATRSVTLDGVAVEEGQYIGLVDGRLAVSASELDELLSPLLETMAVGECEILSLYYGEEVSQAEAETFSEQIEALYPDLEIELLAGNQPHYYYILGAE